LPVLKMSRLTGLELLSHHLQRPEMTTTEKVVAAGYVDTKEDGSPRVYFTDYYTELRRSWGWREMVNLSQDSGGTDTVKSIIKAIEAKKVWKKRNDSISVYRKTLDYNGVDDEILVFFHGNLYCIIKENKIHLMVQPRHRTKSTKERLNRILMRFCGCQLYQKNKVWYVYNPQVGDIEYSYGMSVPFVSEVYKD
jgi:hypothetical protein